MLLFWTALLGLFGGFALAALQLPALAYKLKRRSLRFFDLALPATILLFLYLSGPLLYGLLGAPDAIERACRLGGRTVFTWSASSALVPVACVDKPAEPR